MFWNLVAWIALYVTFAVLVRVWLPYWREDNRWVQYRKLDGTGTISRRESQLLVLGSIVSLLWMVCVHIKYVDNSSNWARR